MFLPVPMCYAYAVVDAKNPKATTTTSSFKQKPYPIKREEKILKEINKCIVLRVFGPIDKNEYE